MIKKEPLPVQENNMNGYQIVSEALGKSIVSGIKKAFKKKPKKWIKGPITKAQQKQIELGKAGLKL